MTTLKFAIAGLGRIGKIHLENLLERKEANVVAAFDPMPEAITYAKNLGITHTTDSFEHLLSCTEFDAIIICSPTDTHANYVAQAAKAGKHIFCEKPLDLNLQRVIEVLEVVKQANVKLMLGFNRRFDKEFKKVKEVVAAGKSR